MVFDLFRIMNLLMVPIAEKIYFNRILFQSISDSNLSQPNLSIVVRHILQ